MQLSTPTLSASHLLRHPCAQNPATYANSIVMNASTSVWKKAHRTTSPKWSSMAASAHFSVTLYIWNAFPPFFIVHFATSHQRFSVVNCYHIKTGGTVCDLEDNHYEKDFCYDDDYCYSVRLVCLRCNHSSPLRRRWAKSWGSNWLCSYSPLRWRGVRRHLELVHWWWCYLRGNDGWTLFASTNIVIIEE